MQVSRFHGALAAVGVLAVIVGCAATDSRDEDVVITKAPPRAIVFDDTSSSPGVVTERNQCTTDICRELWGRMHGVPPKVIAPAASAASTSSQGGCPVIRPKPAKKKEAKVCPGPAPAPSAPAASQPAPAVVPATPLPPAPAASVPAFKLADPVTERRASKQVGSYDGWVDRFGYTNGQLVYRPYFFGYNKTVHMTEQVIESLYECSRLRVPETDHVLRVRVTAAVNPSLLWETDYHRLTAVYGAISGRHADKNTVTAEDVVAGVETYLGQHQEVLCRLAATKSLAELLRDPSLGAAEELNRYFRRDARATFDVMVQTTSVQLPEALLRALALKGMTKP